MHLLQTLDLNARPEVERLHFKTREVDETAVASTCALGPSGSLVVPDDETATFDTYFNAFFENCWFPYTSLDHVTLQVTISGGAVVTVWRQTPQLDVYQLSRQVVEGPGPATVQFTIHDNDELRVEPGRVWFEVTGLDGAEVISGGWYTANEPVRDVRLAAVFCTFNREQYLSRILHAIEAHRAASQAVDRIYIVNQGNPFTVTNLVDVADAAVARKIEIIEQDNLGGCGGFTRGMYETWRDPDLTHFVVLDDDSRMHADSLVRVRQFLAYSREKFCVGGHMLNLHRPKFLFEAGANLNASSLQPEPVHQGRLLSEYSGLEALLRVGPTEYNGWWFFAAPKTVLDEIGFPMPCFIRGDDIEFGMRLSRSGWSTLPVPGIGVWHEPFYLKMGNWQLFFEVRNRLMAASIHDDCDWQGVISELRKTFTRDVAMSRYHSAQLLIDAINAYLQGPDACFRTDDGPLQAARGVVAELGPTRVDNPPHVESRAERMAHRDRLRKATLQGVEGLERRMNKVALAPQLAWRLARRGNDAGTEPTVRAADLVPFRVARHSSYLVVEDHENVGWRYERRPEVERRLWQDFIAASRNLERNPAFAAAHHEGNPWQGFWTNLYSNK